jgi:hypothetical protein
MVLMEKEIINARIKDVFTIIGEMQKILRAYQLDIDHNLYKLMLDHLANMASLQREVQYDVNHAKYMPDDLEDELLEMMED